MTKGRQRKAGRHHKWRTGLLSSHGYVLVRVGKTHPLADQNGYAYEHLVVWVSAGKPMPNPDDLLHHKNEDKTDNRIENLECITRVSHSISHQPSALSDEEVRTIRTRYAQKKATSVTLAAEYGVTAERIMRLVSGKTRRDAGGPITARPGHRRDNSGKFKC